MESQIAHYGNTNGRFVTHFFAQLFLLMGKPVFNVINVFIFLALGVLICFHAKGTFRGIRASELVIAYGVLFLSAPAFGQSFLWLDGSATYSLGIVIAFTYLIPFRRMIHQIQQGTYLQGTFLSNLLKFVWTFGLGVLAGNTSENVGAAMIIFILLCCIYAILHKTKIQLWMLGLGNILGTVLAVVSPGTQSRLAGTGGLTILGMIKNVVFIGANFVTYLQLPLCIFSGLLIANLLCCRKSAIREHLERSAALIIYMISMLAAAFSMILSTQFPERAWSIVVVFAAVVVVHSFDSFAAALPRITRVRILTACILIVLSAGSYVNGLVRLKSIHAFHQERIRIIETAVHNGEKSVEISAIASTSPYSVFDPLGDLSRDSTKWPNTAIARYFGIEEILRAPEDFDY